MLKCSFCDNNFSSPLEQALTKERKEKDEEGPRLTVVVSKRKYIVCGKCGGAAPMYYKKLFYLNKGQAIPSTYKLKENQP